MSWILAIAVCPLGTWVARQDVTEGPAIPQLVPLENPPAVVRDPYALLTPVPAAAAGGGPSSGGDRTAGDSDPRDVVAEVLRTAYAKASGDTRPERIVVTYPDSWSNDAVLALRQAASRAGLGIDPVPEAVALASAYRARNGVGTRLLILDADRRHASAVARMGNVFVALATACGKDRDDPERQLIELAEEALAQPGVRRDLLNEVILTGHDLDPALARALAGLIGRPPTVLPPSALALGALHYDAALHEAPPEPVLDKPAPKPPPAPPPAPRVDHAAPDPGSKRPGLVPLLIAILVILIAAELLFVYWPF